MAIVIAKVGGIRQLTDTAGVQHNEKYPFHGLPSS
jgi:hypothetical protein